MIRQDQVRDLIGCNLVDSSGQKVGKIGQIYLDDETSKPEWATVKTGLFGMRESFVPLERADATGDELHVPYSKDQIKDAPNVDPDVGGHLDRSEEQRLYEHYGLEYARDRSDTGLPEKGTAKDDAMTRSEERLRAGTERAPAGTARLRKWVETEEQQVSVPVRKEKARLETEPVTEANRGAAMEGPDISEAEHEVTLTEERPVVAKETVPKERVRLTKETEQDEEQVSAEVRKERIEAEGDVETKGRKGRKER